MLSITNILNVPPDCRHARLVKSFFVHCSTSGASRPTPPINRSPRNQPDHQNQHITIRGEQESEFSTMSNFEQNPFNPKQRDEQEAYYIQKARRDSRAQANPPAAVPPKDRKYTHGGLNAPLAASHTRNQSAAYPALTTSIYAANSAATARKPVGSTPFPDLDLSDARADRQQPTIQTSLSSGGRTQQKIPLTHRDQNGKYHDQAYDTRPLLSSPLEQAFLPAANSTPAPSSYARPISSSSRWSFGAKKDHADTGSFDTSASRPRSRAGSFTDKVVNGIAVSYTHLTLPTKRIV